MIKPDYQSSTLVNLMASIQDAFGQKNPQYDPLEMLPAQRFGRSENVILMVLDGFGYNFLRQYGKGGNLHKHLLGRMQSIFPTTTTAAVTTFNTGLAPQQHGLPAWNTWIAEAASVIQVLPYQTRGGHYDITNNKQLHASLFNRAAFHQSLDLSFGLVMPENLIHSTYTSVFARDAELFPYNSMKEYFLQTGHSVLDSRQQYIYSYWPMLDTLGHKYGIHSNETIEHFQQLDEAFGDLLTLIENTNTSVIVTGDHGMIDTTAATRLELKNHPQLQDTLALPLCGEPRAVFCYVRPGKVQQFEDYVKNDLEYCVQAIPSEQLIEQGYFGLGEPHPDLDRRVGDYTLLMKSNFTLHDQLSGEYEKQFIGMHGGLSDDELYVPLIHVSV